MKPSDDDMVARARNNWQGLYEDGDQFTHLRAKEVLALCDEIERLRRSKARLRGLILRQYAHIQELREALKKVGGE